MSNYLTTDGLKKKFSTSGGPREACGICHICHMVNPALDTRILGPHLHLTGSVRVHKTKRSGVHIHIHAASNTANVVD